MNAAVAVALTFVLAQASDSARAAASAQPAAAMTRELEQIEQQLAAAWSRGDCDGWGALVAPEWSVIHITGAIITRAEALKMCATQPRVQSAVDQIVVRPLGETAVVTGRTTATQAGATPQAVTLRFTDVFVRRDGKWLAVASHATRLSQ
jgi:hypothetical protein